MFLELPDLWTLVGAALIVGSGLYVFHRERTLAVPVSRPPVSRPVVR
jgi:drug/metabolite transporter (DMT)-like permease